MSSKQLIAIQELDKQSVMRRLADGKIQLPPLEIKLVQEQEPKGSDAIVRASWSGRSQLFSATYSFYSTPKALSDLIVKVKAAATNKMLPLVLVPYLSEEQLHQLEGEKVSGLDLAGNGVVLARSFALFRSGQPNLVTISQPIKNVFSGNSSLVARCFLLRSEFYSSAELQRFASERFKMRSNVSTNILTKSTVSKVLQALEDEFMITRAKGTLHLRDGKLLMQRLLHNVPSGKLTKVEGKTPLSPESIWQALHSISQSQTLRYNVTGSGSAAYYNVLSNAGKLSLYVDDLNTVLTAVPVVPTRVFPNIEIVQTISSAAYFDQRVTPQTAAVWASPLQTWLELMRGDAREQMAARELSTALEKGMGEKLP